MNIYIKKNVFNVSFIVGTINLSKLQKWMVLTETKMWVNDENMSIQKTDQEKVQ